MHISILNRNFTDLLLAAGLVIFVVIIQPASPKRNLRAFPLIAIAILVFLHANVDQEAMLRGLFIALSLMIGATLFREWPRWDTSALFLLVCVITFAVFCHRDILALLLAGAGGIVLRIRSPNS